MATFPERLTEAIEESGIGQNEVARRIGATSYSRLSEWKKGQGGPTVDELVRLADVLGVEVNWLAGGRGPKHPLPVGQEVAGFREMAAIVDRVRATSPVADPSVEERAPGVGHRGEDEGGPPLEETDLTQGTKKDGRRTG